MMHIDKGDYLKLMEGEHGQGEPETVKIEIETIVREETACRQEKEF